MNNKFYKSVTGGAVIVALAALIARGMGLIREIVFAGYFGLSSQYDLYLVGAVIPLAINSVTIYLTQNYFIPKYHQDKQKSLEVSEKFSKISFLNFSILGVLICLILLFTSNFVVEFYLRSSSISEFILARDVYRIMILTIPFSFSISMLSAIQNAEYEFRYPSFSNLFLNISVILVVILFSAKGSILSIAFGYLAGVLMQFIFLLIKTRHRVFPIEKLELSKNLFTFFNLNLFLIVIIETLGQVYFLADRYLYEEVSDGGIAALNYSFNIFLLPITIFSLAISTSLLPRFSESINKNDKVDLNNVIKKFFSINLVVFIPITFIFIFYGEPIIKILFERGNFRSNDTSTTFAALKYYSICIVFFSSYAGISKLVYGSNLIKHLFAISIVAALLKIALNLILVSNFKQNGLAFSSAISYSALFLFSYYLLVYKNIIETKFYFFQIFILLLLNGLLSYAISISIIALFNEKIFIFKISEILIFILIYLLNIKLFGRTLFASLIKMFENIPILKLLLR